MNCDPAEGEMIHGRRAKPYQRRFYSKPAFRQLIEETVRRRGNNQITLCGENVDSYLNESMCLYLSDQTRGVVALRLVNGNDAGVSNEYRVVGVAFYQPFDSTQKWRKVREAKGAERAQRHPENSGPAHLRGLSHWQASSTEPLQWAGTYTNVNSNGQLQTNVAAAMNNERYGEIDLVCSDFQGVGSLLVYYALYDLWKQVKGGAQRYSGVVLSTASAISKDDIRAANGRKKSESEIRNLQAREMRGSIAGIRGLGTYYSRFGFKRARAVHRGTDYDYWAYTEKVLPAYYMVLRGAQWTNLPTAIEAYANQPAPPLPANTYRPGAQIKSGVCRKGERGEINSAEPTLKPPKYTKKWEIRRNVRNKRRWADSEGGRGTGCLY